MKTYAYIRVSTVLQSEARQLDALEALNRSESLTIDRVFVDKLSGRDFRRPAYRAMLRRLAPGDLVVVKSLDRLGRSYPDILEQWRVITKEKGANVRVLDTPLLDTRIGRDLVGTLIADLVLSLLSFTANQEYTLIKARTAEGIASAKARGVRFGRPPIRKDEAYERLRGDWRAGRMSARTAARELGVSHVTFLKWVRRDEGIE